MSKNRLEAFSDGVIAIIITIMVLEIRMPEGTDWAALKSSRSSLLAYLLTWMEESHFAPAPTASYGLLQLFCAIAFTILLRLILRDHGRDSALAQALGRDLKGKLSAASYVLAVPLAFVMPTLAIVIFVVTAAVWLVPDRRIERALADQRSDPHM